MPVQSDKLRLLKRIPDIRFEEEPRGYSRDQVDRVLATLAPLADEIERLQNRLTEAEERAGAAEARLVEAQAPTTGNGGDLPPAPQPDFDETLRNTLVSAQRQADSTVREAREEAERLRTEAEFQSNAMLADARDQAAEMTTEAVAYRESMVSEVGTERTRLLDEARSEARSRLENVETELAKAHDEERTNLIEQILELKDTHRMLQIDVERFENHITSRCNLVRSALEEITGILDDPARLRNSDGIEAAELVDFDAEQFPPIAVEVVALNELEQEAQLAADAQGLAETEVVEGADLDVLAPDPNTALDDGVDVDLDDGIEVQPKGEELSDETALAVDVPPPPAVDVPPPAADDEQIGVATQIIQPPPVPAPTAGNGSGNGNEGGNGNGDDNGAGILGSGDPYLDELRRVTNDDESDDAISDFFDENGADRGSGGWFGRRR